MNYIAYDMLSKMGLFTSSDSDECDYTPDPREENVRNSKSKRKERKDAKEGTNNKSGRVVKNCSTMFTNWLSREILK